MRRPDFDDWMLTLVDPAGPGVAIAVRLRGEVIHTGAYGLANLEWSAPVETDTVFRIASVTKQFTAAAIVRLSEAGKLGIDDPITRWLPHVPIGDGRITIRQLLNHTSGVGGYTGDQRFMSERVRLDNSLAELVDIIAALPTDFAPGERYAYSNSGYVLLGAIIEACSGRDYETCLREELLEPLGLRHTRYLHDGPITPGRACGYASEPVLANAPMLSMNNPHAAGALGSTVHDLLVWEQALRTGRVVSAAGYRAMTTPGPVGAGPPPYHGFGLTRHVVRGQTVIGHGGRIFGFVSHLAHWPEHELTVAALANSNPFPIEQAAFGLARRALGEADAAYAPVALRPEALRRFAGAFRFPNTEVLDLKLGDGVLTSDFPRAHGVYKPFGDDRFFLTSDPEVTIRFDPAGETVTFQAYELPMTGTRTAA